MIDGFGRNIEYLRISITDRCNLCCRYCMPEKGIVLLQHEDILRYEELERLVCIMAGLEILHVRVTGGDPMVWPGCLDFVRRLNQIPDIESISMTSNGILLAEHIDEAKRAELNALNLSLDTLDPARYSFITRGGEVTRVLETLARLAQHSLVCVRFIELMPIGSARRLPFVPQWEITEQLEAVFGPLFPDETLHGFGPARYGKSAALRGE